MENESISKAIEEALKKFEAKTNQVPLGYFDQFELDLMQKIKSDAELPKKALIFPLFSNQKKEIIISYNHFLSIDQNSSACLQV